MKEEIISVCLTCNYLESREDNDYACICPHKGGTMVIAIDPYFFGCINWKLHEKLKEEK